jgi:hypothetical protein
MLFLESGMKTVSQQPINSSQSGSLPLLQQIRVKQAADFSLAAARYLKNQRIYHADDFVLAPACGLDGVLIHY